jgi:hypothetical protein
VVQRNSRNGKDVAQLAQGVRDGSGELNRGAMRLRAWWRDELGIGGVRMMNSSSSSLRWLWHRADRKEEKERGASIA